MSKQVAVQSLTATATGKDKTRAMFAAIFMFVMLGVAIIWWHWGLLRHDLVAMILLFVLVFAGIVPSSRAFIGFSHPAVIMLVSAFIISRSFQESGIFDYLGERLDRMSSDPLNLILVLSLIAMVSSAFLSSYITVMLLMPVALHLSGKRGIHASRVLLPVAFSAILGSTITMIGSVPNIFVSCLQPGCLGIFTFAPTNLPIALIGVLFLGLVAGHLLHKSNRKDKRDEDINIEDYITEVKVLKESRLAGSTLRRIMQNADYEVTVIALVREKLKMDVIDPDEELLPDDILIIEADSANLKTFMNYTNAKLMGGRKFRKDLTGARNISMREVVVLKDSILAGKTAAGINIRSRFGINLLAISRGQRQSIHRLAKSKIKRGDVLLIQGRTQILDEVTHAMGCMALKPRGIKEKDALRATLSIVALTAALILMGLKVVSPPFALASAALLLALCRTVSPYELMRSIDWSLVILLAAMIPVGEAFRSSGAAEILVNAFSGIGAHAPLWLRLGILMGFSMLLSNIIHNVPATILMAAIALQMAAGNIADSRIFLTGVALSCTANFMSVERQPVNTLVKSAGGYQNLDYIKVGLVLQILVLVLGVVMLAVIK
ncbi:MAG TPA: SLC13 family permease [Candidatus Cloacimonetes bacterium]|nr:SLC13 family permease [Candidatus Cloacimonadota bacterium]